MAIDLAAIRKKLNQISGQNSRKNSMWRPEEGSETTVRLMAYPDNDGQPFKELMFYYNIGNNPGLLSPYQFSKPDPIQELITKLRDEGSKESYELAKKLYPKMRCYAPVIVRGEEEKGVRLWAFGKQVYQTLLNYMLDEDYGDITDVDQGTDLVINYGKPPGAQFPQTTIVPRRKSSPLAENADKAAVMLDSIPSFDDVFESARKTPSEIQQMLDEYLLGEEDAEDVSTETNKYQSAAPSSNVDQAFAELSGS